MNEQLLRLKQVVQLTNISRATIWRWVKAGSFPKPMKITNRVVVWKNSDIQAYIASVTQSA
ncbi:MAG: AlpA family phage regulatory protein [Campylobacteraceae bacterium]|jgi:prophage regulatory protein|nr:AlpA family phage regulatory protein [Campylobacteraceae bacterium]